MWLDCLFTMDTSSSVVYTRWAVCPAQQSYSRRHELMSLSWVKLIIINCGGGKKINISYNYCFINSCLRSESAGKRPARGELGSPSGVSVAVWEVLSRGEEEQTDDEDAQRDTGVQRRAAPVARRVETFKYMPLEPGHVITPPFSNLPESRHDRSVPAWRKGKGLPR